METAKYKLTIAILTMNRSDQLKLAIESCIAAKLPEKTQFVVVDNGSVDDTETIVNELQKSIGYDLVYQKEPVNRGAGLGRNICFNLAEGEYVFFLDDDAEISKGCREIFFLKSIDYLDRNTNVASLTTEVVDNVFGERLVATSTKAIDSLSCAYSFHEGAVFLRISAFSSPLYMDIVYGSEHLSVSTRIRDAGYHNVFDPSISIDHHPKVDKWHESDPLRREYLLVQGISNTYAIKRILYPSAFIVLLYLAYRKRLKNCNVKNKKILAEFKENRKALYKKNRVKKIKWTTVIQSFREFGLTVF